MDKFWEVRRMAGKDVEVGPIRVVPEAQAVVVRGSKFGLVWNRPLGVRISTDSSEATSYMPVRDVTRIWQLAFYGLTIGFTLLGWIASTRIAMQRE